MKHCAKILKVLFVIYFVAALFSGCSAVQQAYFFDDSGTAETGSTQTDTLTVQYIDVGQADAALLTCGGDAMLIDGGNVADGQLVADTVSASAEKLNYVVNTHAHEDHCGGLTQVVESIEVENAIISQKGADTKCYTNFINALEERNVYTVQAEPGMEFALGDATCTVIGPTAKSKELNNTSVVLRVDYAGKVFLFMGDAENAEERAIIQAGYDVKCDVLKAGHHGSDTSSGYVFLREAQPEYVIISVGANNKYGHPDGNTLSRFRDVGAAVYRTDQSGSITVVTDKNGNIQIYE